jgi:PHP family Zn ribbon phosphoesterase
VLLDVKIEEIRKIAAPAITDAIQVFREKKVIIIPGGGGQYGKIELPNAEKVMYVTLGPKDKQTSLSDY